MDGSKCILQVRGIRPFLSDKFDITKHKNYRYLSDANPKYAFDVGKHLNRKLKVKPVEKYEYFEYVDADEGIPAEAYVVLGDAEEEIEIDDVHMDMGGVMGGVDDIDDLEDFTDYVGFDDFPEDLEPV